MIDKYLYQLMASRTVHYLRLMRPQSAAGTGVAPVIGALAVLNPDMMVGHHLLKLFLIGLLVHFYGFCLNEYMDLPVDSRAKELKAKPLVSGIIPQRHALYMALSFITLAFILSVSFFKTPESIALFALSAVLGGAYDVYSKKLPASDILLGIWVFVFCLYGSSTVDPDISGVGSLAYLVAAIFFLQLVFQTGVTGGLKDVKQDFASGAKTPPIWFGTRLRKGNIFIPSSFKGYALFIKTLNICAVAVPFIIWSVRPTMLQIVLLPILLFFIFYFSVLALHGGHFKRREKMRYLMVQEFLSYMLIPLLLVSFIPLALALMLLVMPILWYIVFTVALYGPRLPTV